jgi:hypothetical protein|tara:strand:+ start:373 stop:558 length:186 start_codon:yes stop_codon:yes gene_type:complete
MGLISKTKPTPTVEEPVDKLTAKEIEFTLSILRESTFKGAQVVDLYNTVLKLQQQHKNLPK